MTAVNKINCRKNSSFLKKDLHVQYIMGQINLRCEYTHFSGGAAGMNLARSNFTITHI